MYVYMNGSYAFLPRVSVISALVPLNWISLLLGMRYLYHNVNGGKRILSRKGRRWKKNPKENQVEDFIWEREREREREREGEMKQEERDKFIGYQETINKRLKAIWRWKAKTFWYIKILYGKIEQKKGERKDVEENIFVLFTLFFI